MSTPLLPPFIYYGGKSRLAAQIAAMLPEHRQYVEPFAGGLSVLLAKRPSRLETVSDIDGDLMVFWRMLRDQPAELARVCAMTPHSRAERDLALQRPPDLSDVERARRVWVCLSQGRSGTLRPTGWRFTVDDSAKVPMPHVLASYVNRMSAVAQRIRNVSLENRPALELIEAFGKYRNTLLYVDPPYLASTRSVGGAHNYRYEMSHADQHTELAHALIRCRATVVLSGYPNALYDELYRGWHRYELDATTSQGGTHQTRTEVLWSNRPLQAPPGDIPLPLDDFDEEAPPVEEEFPDVAYCAVCSRPMIRKTTGRPRTTCSDGCRTELARRRRANR